MLGYISNIQFLRLTDISAYPHSVNILEGVQDDIRTPDKLVDGVSDTMDGGHMWLAPVLPNMVSFATFRFYLLFVVT